MKRPRRNHSPAFKARMALEALTGEQTLAQRSRAVLTAGRAMVRHIRSSFARSSAAATTPAWSENPLARARTHQYSAASVT